MDRINATDRYWYIYEADDIDLDSGGWVERSRTAIDWEKTDPADRDDYLEMMRTGWDGTGYWYERSQDSDRQALTYPLVQVVKHEQTGKQHVLSLVPFPDRGDPKFVFYLPYMPFFLEPADLDERYQSTEDAS